MLSVRRTEVGAAATEAWGLGVCCGVDVCPGVEVGGVCGGGSTLVST